MCKSVFFTLHRPSNSSEYHRTSRGHRKGDLCHLSSVLRLLWQPNCLRQLSSHALPIVLQEHPFMEGMPNLQGNQRFGPGQNDQCLKHSIGKESGCRVRLWPATRDSWGLWSSFARYSSSGFNRRAVPSHSPSRSYRWGPKWPWKIWTRDGCRFRQCSSQPASGHGSWAS